MQTQLGPMIVEKSLGLPARDRHVRPLRHYTWRVFLYALVFVGSALSMFPFIWAVVSSGKSIGEIHAYPPTFWPRNNLFTENYTRIWTEA
ncbi:MAG: hypothetical protein R6X02_18720, partial [Enhygromyxa sp.]